MDYTQLIERLHDFSTFEDCDQYEIATLHEAAQAIEALQARVKDLNAENLSITNDALKFVAERDAALAKLRELEAQPSPTALELMTEYSNGKQWALEEAAKICDSTPPHPFRPSIEAAWAIRKLKEGL